LSSGALQFFAAGEPIFSILQIWRAVPVPASSLTFLALDFNSFRILQFLAVPRTYSEYDFLPVECPAKNRGAKPKFILLWEMQIGVATGIAIPPWKNLFGMTGARY